ncbi:TPA: AAA family ATPase [Pseudomonas putida]|nr:AAA family ATPase [Pseudomonas putida]
MQRFVRSNVPPQVFRESRFKKARKELLSLFTLDKQERSQTRITGEQINVDLNQIGPVHDALGRLFRGKCAFCESQDLTIPYRFRAASSVTSKMGMVDSHLYYVWLANAWDNIYPICQECIPRQPAFFPVDGRRMPIPNLERIHQYVDEDLGSWSTSDSGESPYLLDPCNDRFFERHLFPSIDGELLPLSERGDITIANFRLDRIKLRKARARTLKKYREQLLALNEMSKPHQLSAIQHLFNFDNLEYGGLWYLQCRLIARYLLIQFNRSMSTGRRSIARTLSSLLFLGDYRQERKNLTHWIEATDFGHRALAIPPTDYGVLQPEPTSAPPKNVLPHTYPSLSSMQFDHFKAIEHLKLKFQALTYESPLKNAALQPALLILGENATGKSSILEAIALALSTRKTRRALNLSPASFVLSPAHLGSSDADAQHSAKVRLTFSEGRDKVLTIDSATCKQTGPRRVPPVFAYGAFRQYQKKSPPVYDPAHGIINLFENDRLLANPEQWILGLKGEDFNDVARALKIIMSVEGDIKVIEIAPDGKSCLIVTAPAGVVAKTPLNDVSSGYRAILAMVCDIMQRLMDRAINPYFQGLEHAQAVVLIDEVEAHLHPRWKIQIMQVLRRALPKVTFIATSHDPLCLRGMENGEVVVVHRRSKMGGADTQYATCIEQLHDLPDSTQLTIEQLLTSDFFNLISTDQPATEKQLANIADVLNKRKQNETLTDEEHQVMQYFKQQVNEALPIGSSEAQRVVQEAVAEFLHERQEKPSIQWKEIRETAKEKILNILRSY